jgi:hypothetical protein
MLQCLHKSKRYRITCLELETGLQIGVLEVLYHSFFFIFKVIDHFPIIKLTSVTIILFLLLLLVTSI